jgi:hypothetical protein
VVGREHLLHLNISDLKTSGTQQHLSEATVPRRRNIITPAPEIALLARLFFVDHGKKRGKSMNTGLMVWFVIAVQEYGASATVSFYSGC